MKRNILVAGCFPMLIALLVPWSHGQCQPSKPAPVASSGTPQFYDEPQFTVAGVADATNLGGHGSDAVVRTKETLARDTALLSKQTASSPPTTSYSAEERALRETAERDPRNFDANHKIGNLLAKNGKSAEAILYLERAARLNPGDYGNSYALAVAYANAGHYEESRALLATLMASAADKAELHHLLAEVEEKLKHPLDAVREYQRAAELNPTEPYLFDWGTELLAHRAPEAAIEVFAKGNRLFPNSVRMLVGLGVAWHARGSYDQAADCLCAASDLNPADPMPYFFLAKMQNAKTIQSAAVVERLARFVRLHPENALANYYYAAALWNRAKAAPDATSMAQAQVRSLLEEAIHLDSKLGLAYLLRGITEAEAGDLPKAISSYQKAIAASPQLEEPHYRLAQMYRRTGEKIKVQLELKRYEELSKQASAEAERERHEIPQFVIALRDAKPTATQPDKP